VSSGSQAPSRNQACADCRSVNCLTSVDLPMPASPATSTTRPPVAVAASRPPSSPSAEERCPGSRTVAAEQVQLFGLGEVEADETVGAGALEPGHPGGASAASCRSREAAYRSLQVFAAPAAGVP